MSLPAGLMVTNANGEIGFMNDHPEPSIPLKNRDETDDSRAPKSRWKTTTTLLSTEQLDGFCELNSISRPAVFQVAWALVLQSYSGRRAVSFGYRDATSGRERKVTVDFAPHEYLRYLFDQANEAKHGGEACGEFCTAITFKGSGEAERGVPGELQQHEVWKRSMENLGLLVSICCRHDTVIVSFESLSPAYGDFETATLIAGFSSVLSELIHSQSAEGDKTTFEAFAESSRALNLVRAIRAVAPADTTIVSPTDKPEARALWENQFVGPEPTVFPSLPSTSYSPSPSAIVHRHIELHVREERNFPLQSKIFLAWGIVQSLHQGGSDDAFFGRNVPRQRTPKGATGDSDADAVIPWRITLDKNETILEAWKRLEEIEGACVRQQHAGLEDAVHQTHAAFQTLLIIQRPDEESSEGVRKVRRVKRNCHCTSPYAITIACDLSEKGMTVKAYFDEKVVHRGRMRRLLDHFAETLSLSLSHSDWRISQLKKPDKHGLEQLARLNNNVPQAVDTCVHDIIRQHSEERKNVQAVCAWDGSFTYGQLEDLSNRLAGHLASQGLEGEMFVPLCFEKSRWTVVAMMAVMKAGAAFVLLDPSQPHKRLRDICDEVKAGLILSSRQNSRLASDIAAKVIVVNDEMPPWYNHDSQNPPLPTVFPSNALYVVFTSGSTGKPKGVVIEHRSYCSSASAHITQFNLDHNSRVCQFASYAFDVSIMEILSTLMAGGCVCVLAESERTDRFAQAANTYDATHAFMTPSFARTLSKDDLRSIHTMVMGGECMTQAEATYWSERVRLMNAYGPAECSVNATVQPHVIAGTDTTNIGFPTGCVCWIVDPGDHNVLLPIGAVGEILIEGPIVGRGYLNDINKSAAAFIDAPSWLSEVRQGGHKARMYKTGDLGMHNGDGRISHAGRKDSQVKIRGQRIELGEVERHVKNCFDGDTTQVVAEVFTPKQRSNPMLAAFVCQKEPETSQGKMAETSDLFRRPSSDFLQWGERVRSQLTRILPSAMIPAIFIPLAYVPVTGTGKTDRKLLREKAAALSSEDLDTLMSESTRNKKDISTSSEQLIQALFAEAIGIPATAVGANDNFFRLGGDSIVAIHLAASMRKSGCDNISVADIFRHPRVAELALVVTSKRNAEPEKHLDLDLDPFSLLRNADRKTIIESAKDQCAVSVENIEDIYPCTALQEGMIALSTKKPGMYTGQVVFRLPDSIDIHRFKAAWQATADANPILRTRIIQAESGGMFQTVIRMNVHWDEGKCLEGYVSDNSVRKTMGIGSPLARFAITTSSSHASRNQYFILTMHHALGDGWSLPLLISHAAAAYSGSPPELPPFRRFIQHILDQDQNEVQHFWKTQFVGLEVASFPELPSASYVPSPEGCIKRSIEGLEVVKIEHTMSTRVRLAWALVLAHYTDSNDVVFGATVTGRNAPIAGIEEIAGPTISTFPLRVQLQSEDSIETALSSLQNQATGMIPFEQAGLQRIQRVSAEAAVACGFQTHIGIQPPKKLMSGDIFLEDEAYPNDLEDYAEFASSAVVLLCHLQHKSDDIAVRFNYDRDILEDRAAERIVQQFEHVLRQVCQYPDMQLSQVEVVSPQDILQLQFWNKNVPPSRPTCLHDLILDWCSVEADKIAVSAWDGDLTYADLDRLSLQLATHLIDLNVGRGVLVPLCFEKSKWPVVAIVAVLRTGAACVLIDPAHPRKRVAQIVTETRAPIILASRETQEHVAGLSEVVIISPSTVEQMRDGSSDVLPIVHPEDPAFIIFTSGSTGTPKGIVMPHRALSTSIRDHSAGMGFNRETRCLHFAAYAFDISTYEVCTTLANGGCLCVPSECDRMNDIEGFIARQQVNVAILTPSYLSLLRPEDVPSLKTITIGGESVTQETVNTWNKSVALINGYGPAEATICALGRVPEEGWKMGTFGHITGGVGWIATISDPSKLAAVGAVGELLIEGHVLATGYLNDSEKTQASFLENPPWLRKFRLDGKGRLYKSGDLVQYNPDGSLRFIGRKDTQIKLRGQRIELGEVETHVLKLFEGSQDVIAEVVRPKETESSAYLAVFIALEKQNEGHSNEGIFAKADLGFQQKIASVRAKLQRTVPRYMVPAVFMPLIDIPKTFSGKIDRRKLRDTAALLSRAEFEAYTGSQNLEKQEVSTEIERQLRDIWARVLNLPRTQIGVDDSFLSLGGDSIGAMRVASMARTAGLRLQVTDIFANQELGAIAKTIWDNSYSEGPTAPCSLSDLPRVEVDLDLLPDEFLPHGSEIEEVLPATEAQSFVMARYPWTHFSFALRGKICVDRLSSACDAVTQKHSILRTLFLESQKHGIVQVILKQQATLLTHIVASEDLDAYAAARRAVDAATSVTQVRQPTEFSLISSADGEQHIFVVRLSHAQYDGVSLPVLFRDLTAAYNGAPLDTSTTFASYIKYRDQERRDTALRFWKDFLAGSTMTRIEDAITSPARMNSGTNRNVSETQTIPLPTLPRGITLATLMKAAWILILSHLTGDTDILFGQTVNGRSLPLPGIESILGPCVNYIPFRATLDDTQRTVESFLQHVQTQHVRAMPFDYLDLADIVDNATSWRPGTQLSSIVQHQNIETDISLHIPDTESSFSASGDLYPANEVWITSTPDETHLSIQVCASSRIMTAETAASLAGMMGKTVQLIPRFADEMLSTVLDVVAGDIMSDGCVTPSASSTE